MTEKITAKHILLLAALAAAAVGLTACSNSPLRNFTEAGLETALDDPLPTPTVKK